MRIYATLFLLLLTFTACDADDIGGAVDVSDSDSDLPLAAESRDVYRPYPGFDCPVESLGCLCGARDTCGFSLTCMDGLCGVCVDGNPGCSCDAAGACDLDLWCTPEFICEFED